jgi:hypothetical protein
MKTAARTATPCAKIPKTCAGLMSVHLLRPIHDQVDAENAAGMIDLLAGHKLNAGQDDYLDLLSDLYEKWESVQFPVSRARRGVAAPRARGARRKSRRPRDAPRHRCLARLPPRARRASVDAVQIRKLAHRYGIDPAALLP